ncbi:TPA: hypothetical protein N0F65_007808 [Lagenidium giganteum]|uniref:EF-hand domain-containing protein n=1 Tax=Lagenidium giganteum TaxID=4803 RepID=A0AAV2Z493_9STRA|nr:TPA: hypothetical protein N0F65_007808 [Lagenidium giganteum]
MNATAQRGYRYLRQERDVRLARQEIDREDERLRTWWKTEPEAGVDHGARARKLQEDMFRFEQNAWLGKHAKHRRFEFSAEQKRMLRQWFDALDSDGSGMISVEELEDPMLSIGIVTDAKEVQEIMSRVDKNDNGLIDFDEFVDFLTPHSKSNKGSMEKHEAMFLQLTKKMEHQSSGFLEINTQLSMERRRFILDAITRERDDAMQLPDLKTLAESKHSSNAGSRHMKSIARKKKLKAMECRHQMDTRLSALEKVFERNGVKLHTSVSAPAIPTISASSVLSLDRSSLNVPSYNKSHFPDLRQINTNHNR